MQLMGHNENVVERNAFEVAEANVLPSLRASSRWESVETSVTMELLAHWHLKGRQEGRREGITQGKEALVERQLRRCFGGVPADVTARLERLSPDQLDDLCEALLDFSSHGDLEQRLARH